MQEFIIPNRKHPKLIQIISDDQSGLRRVNGRKEFQIKALPVFLYAGDCIFFLRIGHILDIDF